MVTPHMMPHILGQKNRILTQARMPGARRPHVATRVFVASLPVSRATVGVSEKILHWQLERINAYQGSQLSVLAAPQGGFNEPILEQKCIFFTFWGRSAARRAHMPGSKFDFLAQNVGHYVGTHYKLQSGRLVDSGAS